MENFTWDEEQLEGIGNQLVSYLKLHTKLDDIKLEVKVASNLRSRLAERQMVMKSWRLNQTILPM
jgi:hypothetical protein